MLAQGCDAAGCDAVHRRFFHAFSRFFALCHGRDGNLNERQRRGSSSANGSPRLPATGARLLYLATQDAQFAGQAIALRNTHPLQCLIADQQLAGDIGVLAKVFEFPDDFLLPYDMPSAGLDVRICLAQRMKQPFALQCLITPHQVPAWSSSWSIHLFSAYLSAHGFANIRRLGQSPMRNCALLTSTASASAYTQSPGSNVASPNATRTPASPVLA